MSSGFSQSIESYWAACETLKDLATSTNGDDVALSQAEKRVEALELSILAACPVSGHELLLKSEFIRRLIQECAFAPGPADKLLSLLERDIAAFIEFKS